MFVTPLSKGQASWEPPALTLINLLCKSIRKISKDILLSPKNGVENNRPDMSFSFHSLFIA